MVSLCWIRLSFRSFVVDLSKVDLMIIIDNFCIALFSGVPKLTALYNILQHFTELIYVD